MHEKYKVNVTRVIDGDTFVGNVDSHVLDLQFTFKEQYFRLEGINAKEIRGVEKPFGLEAKDFLERLILDKTIEVDVHGKEKYGRWLVIIWLGDLNINNELVRVGYAERREY